jgi:hypothetical protein
MSIKQRVESRSDGRVRMSVRNVFPNPALPAPKCTIFVDPAGDVALNLEAPGQIERTSG